MDFLAASIYAGRLFEYVQIICMVEVYE